MTMTDPIADLLTRMRNINRLGRKHLKVPYSKLKERIVRVFKEEGYITEYSIEGEGTEKCIRIELKFAGGTPVITALERVSRPGRRVYTGVEDMQPVLRGMGTHVVSTPQGIMTDREARKRNVGGEILVKIY